MYIYVSDRRLSLKVFAIKERYEDCYSLEWCLLNLEKEQDCVCSQRYKLIDCNSVHSLESSDNFLCNYRHTKRATITKRRIGRTVQAVLLSIGWEDANRVCHCTPNSSVYLITPLSVILFSRASACFCSMLPTLPTLKPNTIRWGTMQVDHTFHKH